MIPGGVNPMLLSAGGSGYQLQRSLRFRSAATASLTRTLGAPTNNLRWTWSGWVKRGTLGSVSPVLFSGMSSATNYTSLFFTGDNLSFSNRPTSGVNGQLVATGVLRDPSAWYHIVAVFDSANATATNRMLLYVNNVPVTSFSTANYPTISGASIANSALAHYIGNDGVNNSFDGYLSDVHCIDGQALTPAAFGQFDSNGMWQPKPYTGTYGSNGFRLQFDNTASLSTLTADSSGNGNDWTANNISLTAGATYDSMLDVPLGGGGAERGNYCVMSNINHNSTIGPPSECGLKVTGDSAGSYTRGAIGTIAPNSGKWYWEVTPNAGLSSAFWVGVTPEKNSASGLSADLCAQAGALTYRDNGTKCAASNSGVSYGSTYTIGDTVGVALDLQAGTLTFYKNNVSQGVAFTGLTGAYAPLVTGIVGASLHVNFGQRPFAHTPPTGFKPLHTGNLPTPSIKQPNKHFDVGLYTGNGVSLTRSGFAFQPDLVWLKSRSNSGLGHRIVDSVRGVGVGLASHSTNGDFTDPTGVTSFNVNGYSLGADATYNTNTSIFVDWVWKAGGAAVTNNAGSISSQVSANPLAGISVVTYTGVGLNATVGHGLGVAPKMILVKSRTGSVSWVVGHAAQSASPWNNLLILNLVNQTAATSTVWNNTAPTSSVFSIATDQGVNSNTAPYVAYCFAEIPGFSKFASYIGNGSSDGPFVHLGFRPRWILIKGTNGATGNETWVIKDAMRPNYNVANGNLYANLSGAEDTSSSVNIDITANGFKVRGVYSGINTNGVTYVFAAFAEAPFQSALAR